MQDFINAIQTFRNPLLKPCLFSIPPVQFHKIFVENKYTNTLIHWGLVSPEKPWIQASSRDFIFSLATLDVDESVFLYVPEGIDDDVETPLFYVVGIHDVYDTPVGIENRSVSSHVTKNKEHLIVFSRKPVDVNCIGKDGRVINVSNVVLKGRLAMLMVRILFSRSSAPEFQSTEFGKNSGRWSDLETMKKFQESFVIGSVEDVQDEVGIVVNGVFSKDVKRRYGIESNYTDGLENWDIATKVFEYNDFYPNSPFLKDVYEIMERFKAVDGLDEQQKEELRQAWSQTLFLTQYLPSMTTSIAAKKQNNYWICSKDLTVQDSELDVGFGDLFRRSMRSLKGAGALMKNDVLYYSCFKDSHGRLAVVRKGDEKVRFVVKFEEDIQVNGFWSINVYHGDTLAQLKNPYGIYAINGDYINYTDYERKVENALQVILSVEPEGESKRNWLPILSDIPFNVVLRCYSPKMKDGWIPPLMVKQVFRDGTWIEDVPESYIGRLYKYVFS